LNRIKNIIFDLDGTLIDSSRGIVEAVNYALAESGDKLRTHEEIVPYIGYPLSQMFPNFSERSTSELYDLFREKAIQSIVPSTEALPEVENVLEHFYSEGYQMSIATTKIRAHIEGILDKLEWRKYFHSVIGGDEVKQVKPNPEMFLTAIERLDATIANTVVVGDTENDIIAAQAIPVKSVAVKCPYGGEEKVIALKPDFYLNSISELPDIFSK